VADEPTNTGFGRLLVAIYATFALAATARAGVQLVTRYDEAPLAYLLSALSAVVYVVATIALARSARTVATATVAFELIGVLVVGTLSVLDPAAFPDETVWSDFGRGYLFIPLVLPLVGLYWLRRTASSRA
jgi:hypothetical protein